MSVLHAKVGAPPEVATLLEEIGRERYSSMGGGEIGADPELDEFMVTWRTPTSCYIISTTALSLSLSLSLSPRVI